MLRFSEEIMLLLLDDGDGTFVDLPVQSLEFALAGSVLMDLAMEGRIDTDPERLFVVDRTPIDDDLLEPTFRRITSSMATYNTRDSDPTDHAPRRRYPRALSRAAGGTRRSARGTGPLPVGIPYPPLPGDRQPDPARGQAAHHGGAVHRSDPRFSRHRPDRARRCVRHLQQPPVEPRVEDRHAAHPPDQQARSDSRARSHPPSGRSSRRSPLPWCRSTSDTQAASHRLFDTLWRPRRGGARPLPAA